MTWYCAELLASSPRPARAATSTVRWSPGRAERHRAEVAEVDRGVVPRVDQLHLLRPRDRCRPDDCGIVSVTGICTSCELPPSWIVTLKTRLVLVATVFRIARRQHLRLAAGAARERLRPGRCSSRAGRSRDPALGVPPMRSRISIQARWVIDQVGSARKCDAGTVTW